MNNWKDIAIAPKDGTPILVGCWQQQCIWNKTTKSYDKAPDTWAATVVSWYPPNDLPYSGEWTLVATGEFASSATADLEVTHWTEIPTPPQSKP
jgi:hypothetical protein